MPASKRLYRLRSLRRRMPFETFDRTVPWRAGWKREYFGGRAHVRPSWTTCVFELDLTSRAETPRIAIRPATPQDRPALLDAFLDAFRFGTDYCDYPMAGYRQAAAKYYDAFFGGERGAWSAPASCLAVEGDRVVAAALVKERASGPLLDCVYARPERLRKGLATAVAAFAVNRLVEAGHGKLKSCAQLANAASIAWHTRFGFVELSNWMTPQSRYFNALRELERRREWKLIAPGQEAVALREIEVLEREYERIESLKEADFRAVMPLPD